MLVSKAWLPFVFHTSTYPYQEWDTNHYLMIATIQVRLGAKNVHNTPEPKLQYKQKQEHDQEICNNYYNDRIRAILFNNRFAILADTEAEQHEVSEHAPQPPTSPSQSSSSSTKPPPPPTRTSAGWGGGFAAKHQVEGDLPRLFKAPLTPPTRQGLSQRTLQQHDSNSTSAHSIHSPPHSEFYSCTHLPLSNKFAN